MPLSSIGRLTFDEYPMASRGIEKIGAIAYNPLNDSIIFSDLKTKQIYEFRTENNKLSVIVDRHLKEVKGIDIGNTNIPFS